MSGSANRWELTSHRIHLLKYCAGKGMCLTEAAKDLGVQVKTIRAAAARKEKTEWLNGLFPSMRGKGSGKPRAGRELRSRVDGEIRRLTPEQIKAPLVVPDNAQTKWLTRSWAA